MSDHQPALPGGAEQPADAKPFIDVAAGLIIRPDGSLLLAERPAGKPWAGWWELPGGKIEPGESTLQALARELKEELDIEVTRATPWVTYIHDYPKTTVRLAFCRVTEWKGEPAGIEGQRLAWTVPGEACGVAPLLPATEPPLRWIQLPTRYLVTGIGNAAKLDGFLQALTQALENGIRLVQFREPQWMAESSADTYAAFKQVLQRCHQYGARCLVNSCHPESWWAQADGVQLRAADAHAMAAALESASALVPSAPEITLMKQKIPGLVAVSAHTASDLKAARMLNADFAVLGHVLDTPSHPGVPGMGWSNFAALAATAGLPVFAIGGQSKATLDAAEHHGAHGIAGIRNVAD